MTISSTDGHPRHQTWDWVWTCATALLVLAAGTARAQEALSPATSNLAPAYYVAEFELTDSQAGIQEYRVRFDETLRPYGGRWLVRSGQVVPLEGQAPTARTVVIAFDSLEKARAWYNSPAYAAIRPLRQRSGHTKAYLIEGLPAASMPTR